MSDYIKLVKNKAKGKTECEKILGTKDKVSELAKVYERHAESFHLIFNHVIMEHVATQSFNKDEFTSYKKALGDIGEVLHKCLMESKMKVAEAE
jgi:regulator of sigma D|tara:strand:+ start:2111 stop:2392 length:282 start_codon:yes stop_codon:yes gene_type:complete